MKRSKKELLKKINGGQNCQIVSTAARLGIATAVGSGATLTEISERVEVGADLLYRLLRALVALHIIEYEEDQYRLTAEGEHLLPEDEDSLHAIAAFKGSAFIYRALGNLEQGLRTNSSPFELEHGKPLFEHLEQDQRDAKLFHEAMSCYEQQSSKALLEQYPFGHLGRICDVGGGTGSFLKTIIDLHAIDGTVFDLPHLRGLIPEDVNFVGGSFFDGAPQGFDGYILRNILHDWDDTKCLQILRGIPKTGKLLIFESLLKDDTHLGTFADLSMFVMTPGGKERTLAQFEQLLEQAGWNRLKVWSSTGSKSLIECEA